MSDCSHKKTKKEKKTKFFKDPVYGYIEIDANLVRDVIDTPAFQRLRRIIQTSYEPLYPSATHNRFVHSLGVYYLGNYVANVIQQHSLKKLSKITAGKGGGQCKRFLKVFRYACLLHDIGHAPFSHTGEEFYVTRDKNGTLVNLHQRVADLCKDENFPEGIKKDGDKVAAPHELMSVIVALNTFPDLFKTEYEKMFFARAVTGYKFSDPKNLGFPVDGSFLNCLIRLLNSSLLDVDRLDYLIRDSLQMGFKTVAIDYQRLLEGVRIIDDGGSCDVAFTKRAISVLENIVYAHDAQRKWVRSHPAIGYEAKILHDAFSAINRKFAKKLDGNTIFCESALTAEGVALSKRRNALRISYLCDADILFLLKNIDDSSAHQYLDRKARYAPIWKSEAEYCAHFNLDAWGDNLKKIQKVFSGLVESLRRGDISEINDKTLEKIKKESDKAKRTVKIAGANSNEVIPKYLISWQKEIYYLLALELKSFAKNNALPFNFQILDADTFTSGFATDDLPQALIDLRPQGPKTRFGNVTRVLGIRPEENSTLPKNVYYIFCRKIDAPSTKPELEYKAELSKNLVANLKQFVENHATVITLAFYKKEGETGEEKAADSRKREKQASPP